MTLQLSIIKVLQLKKKLCNSENLNSSNSKNKNHASLRKKKFQIQKIKLLQLYADMAVAEAVAGLQRESLVSVKVQETSDCGSDSPKALLLNLLSRRLLRVMQQRKTITIFLCQEPNTTLRAYEAVDVSFLFLRVLLLFDLYRYLSICSVFLLSIPVSQSAYIPVHLLLICLYIYLFIFLDICGCAQF